MEVRCLKATLSLILNILVLLEQNDVFLKGRYDYRFNKFLYNIFNVLTHIIYYHSFLKNLRTLVIPYNKCSVLNTIFLIFDFRIPNEKLFEHCYI